GVNAATDWPQLLQLGQGVRFLLNLLGRLPKDRISYQPVYDGNSLVLGGGWNDSISGVIHIGVPAKAKGDEFFRLADSNGPAFIDFNGPDAPTAAFVSIVSNLNMAFSNAPQFPKMTATSNHPGSNLNDILEQLMFAVA